METKWFNSMLFNRGLEYRCGLSKSLDSFGPIENNGVDEDPSSLTDMDNNIHSWKNNSENSSYSNGNYLADVSNIDNFLSHQIFAINDSNSYDIYYAYDTKSNWTYNMNRCIESYLRSQICEDSDKYNASDRDIDLNSDICDKVKNSSESHSRNRMILRSTNARTRNDANDIYDTNNISDTNDIYDPFEISDINDRYDISNTNDIYDPFAIYDTNNISDTNDTNDIYDPFADIYDIYDTNDTSDTDDIYGIYDQDDLYDTDIKDPWETSSDIYRRNRENDTFVTIEYSDPNSMDSLWVECETCYGINFKPFFPSTMNICEHCGEHLKMTSSDRIELSIDPGTWNPMDEDMVSLDPIQFDSIELDSIELDSSDEESSNDLLDDEMVSPDPIELDPEEEEEEQSYIDRLDSYQERTGLPEAVQTGTGQLNGIPLAIAVMDSEFIAGSMGAVVGEKITRLIEYATNQLLPLIIVCASGGARMQEGGFSLMQMGKICSALYNYQINQKLFYVAILTSPTTGGVTASFGMLGDIIIAEPNATIAFAGKRVIEQLLNEEVPEGSQSADLLFDKGLLDSVVPRHLLKEVLSELFQFHGFVPLTDNLTKNEN
uniref:Acetyl-coenzyme A carboxylase carboxyl transferase subunit beta, chloroplastic n=1 Tax=Lathyrus tingitanus TaxID=3862 RepID=A0A0F6NKP7_LATTI|nr:acetyl-CoA carboxylase carboxyltransferase beta subunit [Lathyrus tingitanus]AIL56009.1 acetyl-CoA carboxylase carboxyltransferase beta subunit [Lathyrus tingitanus]